MSGTSSNSTVAALQHAEIGVTNLSSPLKHTTHPEAQWFPSAGLGLFIHWGIASVHGNIDLSWGMMANTPWDVAQHSRNKIAPVEYWELAERFQPQNYNPDRWLAAAAAAGCRYAVFTTMHHDGYTLWPSRFSEFGVQTYLHGRDLVGPFVEAARRHGLKVGLYYSPPDWYFDRHVRSFNYGSDNAIRFPDRPFFDEHHQIIASPPQMSDEHRGRRRQMTHRRVEELLTRYGRIDLMWFDGGDRDESLGELVRRLQPHIVTNSRTFTGDYAASECSLPTEPIQGWFETCHCWQEGNVWGYLASERYKSTDWMLETLAYLRARGANLLINVGPRPDGELPDVAYQRLAETAKARTSHV